MKRIFFVGALAILSVACANPTPQPKTISSQEAVMLFLQKANEASFGQANDIQGNAFEQRFEKGLYHLFDTLGFQTQWTGTIKELSQSETNNTINLSFEIICPYAGEYGELTLLCNHLVKKENLEKDKIYKSVSLMRDFSSVRFDGFPRTRQDNTLDWDVWTPKHLRTQYPKIHFWVANIAEDYPETYSAPSDNLVHACNLVLKSAKLVNQNNNKEITKEEYKKSSEELKKANEEASSVLSAEEKAYLQIVSTDAFYNVTY